MSDLVRLPKARMDSLPGEIKTALANTTQQHPLPVTDLWSALNLPGRTTAADVLISLRRGGIVGFRLIARHERGDGYNGPGYWLIRQTRNCLCCRNRVVDLPTHLGEC